MDTLTKAPCSKRNNSKDNIVRMQAGRSFPKCMWSQLLYANCNNPGQRNANFYSTGYMSAMEFIEP